MDDVAPGQGWWKASDGKWYPPHLHPNARPAPPPPPPRSGLAPPPGTAQPTYVTNPVAVYPAHTQDTATGAFVCAIIGAVIGLIPLLGVIAIPLGIVGVVLGIMGWRKTPPAKLARAATILGVLAIVLGIIGFVIVQVAIDDLEENLDEIEERFG